MIDGYLPYVAVSARIGDEPRLFYPAETHALPPNLGGWTKADRPWWSIDPAMREAQMRLHVLSCELCTAMNGVQP